jgi:two-component system, LytTR family, sensor kinase
VPAKRDAAPATGGSMAMLPFSPAPFFADKDRAFWRLQFVGWGGAAMFRAMSAIANGQEPSFLVLVLIEA